MKFTKTLKQNRSSITNYVLFVLVIAISISCQQPQPQPSTPPTTGGTPSTSTLEQSLLGKWVLGMKLSANTTYHPYSGYNNLSDIRNYNDTLLFAMEFKANLPLSPLFSGYKEFKGSAPAGGSQGWKLNSTNQIVFYGSNVNYNIDLIDSHELIISCNLGIRWHYYKYNDPAPSYLDTLNIIRNEIIGNWMYDSTVSYNSSYVYIQTYTSGSGTTYSLTNNTYPGTQPTENFKTGYRLLAGQTAPGNVFKYYSSRNSVELINSMGSPGIILYQNDYSFGGKICKITSTNLVFENGTGFEYYHRVP